MDIGIDIGTSKTCISKNTEHASEDMERTDIIPLFSRQIKAEGKNFVYLKSSIGITERGEMQILEDTVQHIKKIIDTWKIELPEALLRSKKYDIGEIECNAWTVAQFYYKNLLKIFFENQPPYINEPIHVAVTVPILFDPITRKRIQNEIEDILEQAQKKEKIHQYTVSMLEEPSAALLGFFIEEIYLVSLNRRHISQNLIKILFTNFYKYWNKYILSIFNEKKKKEIQDLEKRLNALGFPDGIQSLDNLVDKRFLLLDFGAGTLQFSLVDIKAGNDDRLSMMPVEIVASNKIGGKKFDEKAAMLIKDKFLKQCCHECVQKESCSFWRNRDSYDNGCLDPFEWDIKNIAEKIKFKITDLVREGKESIQCPNYAGKLPQIITWTADDYFKATCGLWCPYVGTEPDSQCRIYNEDCSMSSTNEIKEYNFIYHIHQTFQKLKTKPQVIILVGGMSRFPKIKESLEKYLEIIKQRENIRIVMPTYAQMDLLVAKGAALSYRYIAPETILSRELWLSCNGIGINSHIRIAQKNTTLPLEKSFSIKTTKNIPRGNRIIWHISYGEPNSMFPIYTLRFPNTRGILASAQIKIDIKVDRNVKCSARITVIAPD